MTACGHTFCRECIANLLNGPCVVDKEDPQKYKGNERPCTSCLTGFYTNGFSGPSCRSAISTDKIFVREAFEPQDDDLVEASASRCKTEVNSNAELLDVSQNMRRDPKGKGNAKKRLRQRYSMDDSDDEYEEEKDARCIGR